METRSENSDNLADARQDNSAGTADGAAENRRGFLGTASAAMMAGGLAAGYGTFFTFAGQYLFPSDARPVWLFVARVDEIARGEAITFTAPMGLGVMIQRRLTAADEARAEDFVALSSTCPHLGCRVHWEPHNERFFCPCHNGQFDPEGRPTGGPVLAANQHLPRYELKIEQGMLFIAMSLAVVGERREMSAAAIRPNPRAGEA